MKCDMCKRIKEKRNVVFEDEDLFAYVAENAYTKGHIVIAPKKHIPILEMLDEKLLSKISVVANRLSMVLFEKLGIQGTNLSITNGVSAGQNVPHFSINIIPRKQDDGINFTWDTKKVNEEDLSNIEMTFRKALEGGVIGDEQDSVDLPPDDPLGEKRKDSTPKEKGTGEEDDYLVKQLRRIP